MPKIARRSTRAGCQPGARLMGAAWSLGGAWFHAPSEINIETRQKYDEGISNTVGADHTDDMDLKQPHKLIAADSDGIGGVSV